MYMHIITDWWKSFCPAKQELTLFADNYSCFLSWKLTWKVKEYFYTYTFYIQNYSVYTFCTSLITITFLFFSINSAHNSTVRSFLCQELQKENNGHSKSTTMRKSFLFVNKATGYQYVTCRGSYLHVLISSHLDLMPGQYSSHSHKQLPLWPWI